MELLQLRYFLKSAETENFSITAKEDMVPPSAVSVSIKKLECELGIKLFNRSANKITLNDAGLRFADTVREALFLLDTNISEIKEEQIGISGDIHLLIRTERSFVTDKMTSFREKYKDVRFHLIHDHSITDYSKYDIIVDEISEEYIGFSKKLLLSEKIKIASSSKNELTGKSLNLSDLRDIPFITFRKGSSLFKIAESTCKRVGFKPNFIIESDDPHYIRKYISDDYGIAFFPETSWKHDIGDIAFLNVKDYEFTRHTYAYINEKSASKIAKLFFEHL